MPGSFSLPDYPADDDSDAVGQNAVGQLVSGFLYTPIAAALADLGIPVLLAGKALTAQEVAAAAGMAPDATARLLRAGMAVGLIAAESGGRFTLTDLGNALRSG